MIGKMHRPSQHGTYVAAGYSDDGSPLFDFQEYGSRIETRKCSQCGNETHFGLTNGICDFCRKKNKKISALRKEFAMWAYRLVYCQRCDKYKEDVHPYNVFENTYWDMCSDCRAELTR